MFLWTSGMALIVFLVALLKIFKVHRHPYTILAFSGAITFAIVTVELIGLLQFEWKSLFIIPVSLFLSWYSYSIFKKIGEKEPKEIILKALIPTFFGLTYVFVLNFWFLFPMFMMCLLVQILTPKRIKEQRRNLFVQA